MRKVLILSFLMVFFLNCSSSDGEMKAEQEEMEEVEIQAGDFVSGAHATTGKASVSTDLKTLNFTNFKTDNGPKLLVYLTTAVGSSDFVSLGDLKGVSGNYSYAIPENTDVSKYKIVDIWCVDFSVSFGHEELK